MDRTSAIITPITFSTRAMGGPLILHLDSETDRARAEAISQRLFSRIGCWADRITRYATTSDLMRLNADPRPTVPIRPTLAAALLSALSAAELTGGLFDATLLDARLAVEWSPVSEWESEFPRLLSPAERRYALTPRHRGAIVSRPPGVHLDLSGVGKGFILDRALELVRGHQSVIIDANGDIAARVAPGRAWHVEIEDPRGGPAALATLRLANPSGSSFAVYGVATSGTNKFRWQRDGMTHHHLIDPRTSRSAVTDVVQATVISDRVQQAEALATAAVVAGSSAALTMLERVGARGAVILTDRGEIAVIPATKGLFAH
jgi:thiamine biosynthesis lipoprotein